tara:strand:- start:1427 stop:1801 length:375 start_codon:yes stop_codon:yes gene_type:complete
MIPKKEINIYPKNSENVNALIKYYFAELDLNLDQSFEYFFEKTSLELNQFEFLCRKINEGYLKVFKQNLKGQITLTNLLAYAFDALTVQESEWQGSASRIKITKEFKDFVKQTEIDFDYLETNN